MTDINHKPTTRRQRSVLRWRPLALSAATVVLLAELTVRLVSPALDPVGDWTRTDFADHQDGMRPRADDLDLLVVGSSVVGRAVSPDRLRDAGGPETGYNFWLAGPAMRSISALTSDVLLQQTEPEVVLIGLSMREFNAAPSQNNQFVSFTQSYRFQSAAGHAGTIDRLDHTLQSASYLARYRLTLRDPVRLINDLRTGPLVHEAVGADGFLVDRGRNQVADEPAAHVDQERFAMTGYALNEADLAALATLLDELAARDIPTLVVNLPVTQAFIDMANDGQADYQDYVRQVEAVTRSHGADWLDTMQASWPDENFGDVNHLNDAGTAALQPMILAAINTLSGSTGEPQRGDLSNTEADPQP